MGAVGAVGAVGVSEGAVGAIVQYSWLVVLSPLFRVGVMVGVSLGAAGVMGVRVGSRGSEGSGQ